MVRFVNGLWIALLAAIAAALVACGSVPSPDASRPDANNQDAAVTDRPAPQPDATVAPDTPLPPPPDVPATPDAPPPPPDAHVEDAPVPVMDAPPPPPDATVIVGFDPDICTSLRENRWRVRNSKAPPDHIRCDMNPDGSANVTIGTTFAVTMQSGYDQGRCASMQCQLPPEGASDGCIWSGLSIRMTSFQANCGGRMTNIDRSP